MKSLGRSNAARWSRVLRRMLTWIWNKVEDEGLSERTWPPTGEIPLHGSADRGSVAISELAALISQTSVPASQSDLEEWIAALCVVASVAHLVGNRTERDVAVDLVAEIATELGSPLWSN